MELCNHCKLLIVDDISANLVAIKAVLAPLDNISLVEASSGLEALEALMHDTFAMILLDVNMPEMSGYEVAQIVTSTKSHQHTPIVMITAQGASKNDINQAYESGAVDYIVKPINPLILISKVKQFVSFHRAQLNSTQLMTERETILNAAGSGVLKVTSHGTIAYCNKLARELLKTTEAELVETPVTQWFAWNKSSTSTVNWFTKLYAQVREQGKYQHAELMGIPHQNPSFPVELTCTVISGITPPSLVIAFQDISMRLKLEKHLIHMANYDPLTNLANRAYFHDCLVRALLVSVE